jgi:hypothetical protein
MRFGEDEVMTRGGRGVLALATLVVLTCGSVVAGRPPPAPSIPERVAQAECVVVGEVVRVEDKTVKAVPHWGGGRQVEYQIAVVRIAERVKGPVGLTHVRVGFLPRRVGRVSTSRPLTVGMEACFYLRRHPTETFFVPPAFCTVTPRAKNRQFEAELALARRCARLLGEPLKGLKADKAEDRFLSAALLIFRYRTRPPGPVVEKPAPAEESRLILKALAEADWAKPDLALGYQLAPMNLFSRLGVTNKDGFTRPRNAREFKAAAKKWVAGHADSYRIQKFVAPPREGEE